MHKKEKSLQDENCLLAFTQYFLVKLDEMDLNLTLSLLEAVRDIDDMQLRTLSDRAYNRAVILFDGGAFNQKAQGQSITRARRVGLDL